MHDRELRIKKVESLSVLKNVSSYELSILEYQIRFTQNSWIFADLQRDF
jgi:hypothetical protein